MSLRCASDYSSKLALMTSQVKQYRAMLEATEKAAEHRLFSAHIYEEDKVVLQSKIAKKLVDMKLVMKQCVHR
jgi:hypothetical protein